MFLKKPSILECDEILSFIGDKKSLRWTEIQEELPEAGTRRAHAAFGIHFLNHAGNMLCFILIYGLHVKKFFPLNGIFSFRKDSGKTSHIKRFNLTLRQRVSRLARKTLSFYKNMKNHIGAIWNFIHHYNEKIAPNLVTTP